jgi:hypothetical protein
MFWYWWACGAGVGWWPEWMTAMADQASTVRVPRRRSAAA